jgi:hypothetical protein
MAFIGRMAGLHKGLGLGNFAIDTGLNFMAYKMQGEESNSAMVKGLGQAVLWNAIGPVGSVLMIGGAATAAGTVLAELGKGKWERTITRNYTSGVIGGNYVDTKQALTMRQAAVQAIQQARVNGRQVLGNEASFFHK